MAQLQPPKLPAMPDSLKPILHYLKAANEYDRRDPPVSYWSRYYAAQMALKLDKSSNEARAVILSLMDWLEPAKRALKADEAVTNDIVAQAHVENAAWTVFSWADGQDRAAVFNKNVVKAFYTAGILYDVLTTFGELTEENAQHRKYAKWKAAYVHNCLKSGETPVPGPPGGDEDGDGGGYGADEFTSDRPQPPPPAQQPGATFGFSDDDSNVRPPPQLPSFPPQLPAGGAGWDLLTGDDRPPGGHHHEPAPQAYVPPEKPAASSLKAATGAALSVDDMTKAQKYCKYASSALNYEDVGTAIVNLRKALTLLETGQDTG